LSRPVRPSGAPWFWFTFIAGIPSTRTTFSLIVERPDVIAENAVMFSPDTVGFQAGG